MVLELVYRPKIGTSTGGLALEAEGGQKTVDMARPVLVQVSGSPQGDSSKAQTGFQQGTSPSRPPGSWPKVAGFFPSLTDHVSVNRASVSDHVVRTGY
jgi:hypothetical protein